MSSQDNAGQPSKGEQADAAEREAARQRILAQAEAERIPVEETTRAVPDRRWRGGQVTCCRSAGGWRTGGYGGGCRSSCSPTGWASRRAGWTRSSGASASLDKVSTLQDVAAVLRVDTAVLLGRDVRARRSGRARSTGVDRIRAALSTYDIALAGRRRAVRCCRRIGWRGDGAHAWTTFQYARYPQLVDAAGLLTEAQRAHAGDPGGGRAALVQAYRVTGVAAGEAGEAELAWLAADRAMAAAAGDRVLVAGAAVQLGQVLRLGRARARDR